MSKTKGRVTLPSEGNFLNETKEIMERWGADALRDSDGLYPRLQNLVGGYGSDHWGCRECGILGCG